MTLFRLSTVVLLAALATACASALEWVRLSQMKMESVSP